MLMKNYFLTDENYFTQIKTNAIVMTHKDMLCHISTIY